MAGSLNKVMLIGNLGRDPEIRTNSSGGKIVNMSVATSETWKDKNTGERKETTEWHRVVIFAPALADVVERFVQKGTKVYVEGQLRTRKWTNQQGVDVYTTEVVIDQFRGQLTILDGARGREDGAGGAGMGGGQSGGNYSAPAQQDTVAVGQIADDIPF
ncbi:single-stranded DNA-binding protein [Bacteroidia bacterium]|nr:single-stranded DNA-binding protein [Bacteroidia bacterium]